MVNKIFVYAKGRNLCYYRELDSGIRPRATYIHILRTFRKEVGQVIGDLSENDPLFDLFHGIISICPEKPKTRECDGIILKIKQLYDDKGRFIENLPGES